MGPWHSPTSKPRQFSELQLQLFQRLGREQPRTSTGHQPLASTFTYTHIHIHFHPHAHMTTHTRAYTTHAKIHIHTRPSQIVQKSKNVVKNRKNSFIHLISGLLLAPAVVPTLLRAFRIKTSGQEPSYREASD